MAKLRSKIRPKLIITDKLYSYEGAFNKVFYSMYLAYKVRHLQSEGMASYYNTNMIERFHGTIKQRTKIMRDLKTPQSARIMLDGYINHYNFFMEHKYLGTTPAIKAGIGKGINNWGQLIELAFNTPLENPQVVLQWEEMFRIA